MTGMSITESMLAHESSIRLGFFLSVFAIMALLETVLPRRSLSVSKPRRWSSNLGITVLNTVVLRLLFPTAAIGVALFGEEQGVGLFNALGLGGPIVIAASVVALDLIIYGQHVAMHRVPLLWRLHRVHHVDLDFDVTTGARFHPVEIVLSMLIKFAAILVLGAPAIAVLIFEVVLNATAMFNHSNVRLNLALDRALRLILVTPDMHRVHHSVVRAETDSNYGFSLPWWDRLFGTYRPQPAGGHRAMRIGLDDIRGEDLCVSLPGMLKLPFLRT